MAKVKTGRMFCIAAGMLLGVLALPPSSFSGIMSTSSPGLSPRLGARLPADIVCFDDYGTRRTLGDLLDRPVILSLVYFECAHVCPQVQVGLGRLVQALDLKPGWDYRLITFSFDSADGPAAAAGARRNFTLPLGRDLPSDAWMFITASAADIGRLTSALGFSYQRTMHGFVHPVILVLVAPGGTIARYIYPSRYAYGAAYPVVFSPIEFRRDLDQAARGLVAGPPTGPLLFCYEAEPPGQAAYERLTKTLGLMTLASLAVLFAFLSLVNKMAKT